MGRARRTYDGSDTKLYPGELRPRDPNVTLELALTPDTIESSGGTLTRWRDLSGRGHHGTPSGSPAVSTVSGTECVVFDGVNDRVDGALSLPDQPYTLFLVRKNADTSAGGRKWVFSTTDTGAGLRTNGVLTAFGSAAARQELVSDVGNAQSTTTTNLEVVRVEFTTTSREIFVNGVSYLGSNLRPSPTVRNVTAYRVGDEAGGGFPWAGSVCYVLVYRGVMGRLERERIEGLLMDRVGITRPLAWPLATVAGTQDPRIILPDVMHAVVGRPVKVNKFSAIYWTGAHPSLSATCDLPFDRAPSRYWQVTPQVAGDYEFTLTAGSYSKTTVIRAVDMLSPSATKQWILFVGDSRTNRGGARMIQVIGDLLGSSRAGLVGTVGPQSGFDYKYFGVDSKTWADFDSAALAFYDGGVLDIDHYRTLLAHDPTIIVWSLGQNDVYGQTDGSVDAAITTAFGHVDNLLGAWTASIPTVKHFLAYNWPLGMDPTPWGSSSARDAKRRMVHRYAERLAAEYGGREDELIYLVPRTYTEVDTLKGSESDGIHENASAGHLDLAEAYLGPLVYYGWS